MYLYKGVYYLALTDVSDGLQWITKALFFILMLPAGLIVARIFTDLNFRIDE